MSHFAGRFREQGIQQGLTRGNHSLPPLQNFPLPAGDLPAPRQRQAGGQGEGKEAGG